MFDLPTSPGFDESDEVRAIAEDLISRTIHPRRLA
jgi:hypothetical protein